MTQSVEVSVLLLDSVVRTIEELMHVVDEDAVEPDHQAVLDELHELMKGGTNASEEESADTTVEEPAAEDAVHEADPAQMGVRYRG